MLSQALIWLIRLYQRLSRWVPPVCRFQPTCSNYMIQALQQHGLWRGLGLGLYRILRCNPLCRGGHDPVPPPRGAEHEPEADCPTGPPPTASGNESGTP
jgi:hypothetical protein